MSEQPVSVPADDLHAAGEQAASWVPSGEIERLRETIEVLSDNDRCATCTPAWTTCVPVGWYQPMTVAADLRRRAAQR